MCDHDPKAFSNWIWGGIVLFMLLAVLAAIGKQDPQAGRVERCAAPVASYTHGGMGLRRATALEEEKCKRDSTPTHEQPKSSST